RSTFADFLSMIPTPYAVDLGDIKTSGTLALDALVQGYYSDSLMPGFNISFNIVDGIIQYPCMLGNITNLNINTNISRTEALSFDNTVINVSRMDANFAGNTIKSKLIVKTPITNPDLDAQLLANIDLATLKNVIPMAEGESYS